MACDNNNYYCDTHGLSKKLKDTNLYLLKDACYTEDGGWGHFTFVITD